MGSATVDREDLVKSAERELRILCLVEGHYQKRETSPTFPMVQKSDLYRFLNQALLDEVTAELEFRAWVRQQR